MERICAILSKHDWFKVPTMKHSNRGNFINGKIMGRPSLVKGVSYALALRSPTKLSVVGSSNTKEKGKALVGDKESQVLGGTAAFARCSRVGEVKVVL